MNKIQATQIAPNMKPIALRQDATYRFPWGLSILW